MIFIGDFTKYVVCVCIYVRMCFCTNNEKITEIEKASNENC